MSCVSIRVKYQNNHKYCTRFLIKNTTPVVVSYVDCSNKPQEVEWEELEPFSLCVKSGTTPVIESGEAEIEDAGPCTDIEIEALNDGYLDLEEGFDIRDTKILTELTEIGTLKFDFTLGFELPCTSKNIRILNYFINGNILDNEFKDIEVEVRVGSTILDDSHLYVYAQNQTINCELRLNVQHWARKSKDLKLKQLNYNKVTITKELIQDVNENQFPYNDTTEFNEASNLGI